MQQVLFIPDQLSDNRMWAGIPDRLAGRARVTHLDQHISLSGSADPAVVVPLARRQAPGGWDVLVAAGRGCPLAVALAAASLARGLVLVEPPVPFDRIPTDVDVGWATTPGTEALQPYEALIADLHDATPDEWKDLLVQAIRQTTPSDVAADELDLVVRIAADHAAEARAELVAFEAAEMAGRKEPDDAAWRRQRDGGGWLDQFTTLNLPVLICVPGPERPVGQTIGRLARNLETLVETDHRIVPPSTAGARDQAAAAIERLLDRLG